MMSPVPSEALPDLTSDVQSESRTDLLAGSAGYDHFLKRLSEFLSPVESQQAQKRFRRVRRVLWAVVIAFAVLYLALNQWLGPHGTHSAAWGNDALRAVLFLAAAILVRSGRVAVAGQWLLPLAAVCFLPMPVWPEDDWWQGPTILGALTAALFVTGWCLDAAGEYSTGVWSWIHRGLSWVGVLLFIMLCIVGWLWISDGAVFPAFSIASALGTALYLELSRLMPTRATNDVDFLVAAAWKRWRFLMIGRSMAVVLGILPFLLFTNLLDYQEELKRAIEPGEAPEIVRMVGFDKQLNAFYWREEGRFLLTSDLHPPGEKDREIRAFYYFNTLDFIDLRSLMPQEFRGPQDIRPAATGPDFKAMRAEMQKLDRRTMAREEFLADIAAFESRRINSSDQLQARVLSPSALAIRGDLVVLTFRPVGQRGMVFVETPKFMAYDREKTEKLIAQYDLPKWIFFGIGILGFVFLWRRGGDSTLARWVGIWLVGVSLIPIMTASDDIRPHLTHWLWQQSVMYHWNSLASTLQPLFSLLFIATGAAAILWFVQISPAACWVHFCWPTKIYPQYPPVLRPLMIVGKLAAAFMVNLVLFLIIVLPIDYFAPNNSALSFNVFFVVSTMVFLPAGAVLRYFTRRSSEIPRLGIWPVIAMLALNITVILYCPVLMFIRDNAPAYFRGLGACFGILFNFIMIFLILKRDFLRVRAIAGFTMLVLLITVPLAIHYLEEGTPKYLATGPFFRERGAEMATIMCVVLLFPKVHHWLHEILLLISVPKLRRIEHHVEDALEAIVDADDASARNHTVSDLLVQVRVHRYLFLPRRQKNVFVTDINTLERPVPDSVEFSEPLRHFLGRRRHFIDLQCMAYEWPFFFHQFELFRMAQALGCRYLLPIAVGDSIRAILLLPEGPAETVSNPEVSANIANVGIAASLSRPRT
jgi:hypothetical protein